MYRYLRAEEQRAIDLETQLIESREKHEPSRVNFIIPLSVGIAVGLVGATYLTNKDQLTSVAVGLISGGLIVWSFQ